MAPPDGGRLGRFLSRTSGDDAPTESARRGDPVTHLPGREALDGWAADAVEHSNPLSARAVVAFVDLGLLRDVNDSYGLDAGDRLLQLAAQRLDGIDVPGTRVARYGGAEFALVFEKVAKFEHAEEIAKFLIEMLSEPFDIGVEEVMIAPTVGAALSSDSHETVGEIVTDAHQALVRAREDGPGGFLVIDDSRRGRFTTKIDEERLHDALDNGEFFLHYQPIVRLDNEDVVGVEALLRWQAPGATRSGMLLPGDFLPLLEKTGMAARVGEFVLVQACNQVKGWQNVRGDQSALFLVCNLGARQLAEPGFADTVLRILDRAGLEPWQLCLDITEEALRFNRESTWGALRALKEAGVKLGLDDFGTGMSSLMWLRSLRLDLVKVDRVFVEGLLLNDEDPVIIRHVTALAHDLSLVTIAEGVESEEQAEALRPLGVDLAQGYHFGRPVAADELARRIAPDAVLDDDRWDPSQVMQGD
jgi:diguanylate cyclase (GGDEF)-like protein